MSRNCREVYEFGCFRLDVGEHKLVCLDGSTKGSLREKAFRTLVALVRNSGTLVTKNELLAEVWPETAVEENNLGKAIHAIRHFLGDTRGAAKFVETVPKHGYRFIAEVTHVLVDDPANGSRVPTAKKVFPGRSPAYDLYIRGKVKAGSENTLDTDDAIKVLEAAVAIDPYFAEAYAQLARAYNTRAFKFTSRSECKVLQENADVAIAKAFDLNPDLAEAHFARGLILWTKTKGFPHEQAIRSFRRALELEPDADETHHQLSMVYSHVGLLEEAHEHVARAIDINPNNTMARFRVGVYMAWQCRFEEALAVLKTVPNEVSPMLIKRIRAEVLIQTGQIKEAAELVDGYLEAHPEDEGGSLTSVKALLLSKKGAPNETENMIQQAVELGKEFGHFHHTAYNIASAYAALEKPDEAVAWLEAVADDGFPNYTYFNADPNLDRIRKHPRFIELMRGIQKQWTRLRQLA